MLKDRFTTAAILIPLVILCIFGLNTIPFAIVSGLFTLAAAWEWAYLVGLKTKHARIRYVFLLSILMILLWLLVDYGVLSNALLLSISVVAWLIGGFFVWRYPHHKELWSSSVVSLSIIGVFVLVPFWLGLNSIHFAWHGERFVLFILALVWLSDSAAYFIGRRWGTHKLAPQVSPGKTWQGVMGALVVGFIFAAIASFFLSTDNVEWLYLLVFSVISVIFAILGDLIESMIKRQQGVKDSGVIFPGHGGILDRIDSVTAAVPVFALSLIILGISG